MEVALWGENYDMLVALWGGNYEDGTVGRGGTVGRELWCRERTMEVAL